MISLEFLLTTLVVVLTPGTGALFTISTGLLQGWKASIIAAVGCTISILPHLLASIFGLSFILNMSATVFQWLKLVGALYLLYLAWMMWKDDETLALTPAPAAKPPRRIIWQAVLINLLNPKLTLFFLAFLPLFVPTNSSTQLQSMLTLGGIFMLVTLIVFIVYGVSASGMRGYVLRSPRIVPWLRRSFTVLFAALSIRLVVTD